MSLKKVYYGVFAESKCLNDIKYINIVDWDSV